MDSSGDDDDQMATWTPREWRAWMCSLVTGFTLLFVTRSALPFTIVEMAKEFDWDKRTSGLALSAFFWGYSIVQIPSGRLADRWGGEIVLLYAALASGVTTLSVPIVARRMEVRGVVLLRFTLGIFQGVFFPALSVLVSNRVVEKRRSLSLSLPTGSIHVGTVLCGVLASGLVPHYGWASVYYLSGFGTLLWAGLVRMCVFEKKESRVIRSEKVVLPWRKILVNKSIIAAQLAHFCDNSISAVFYSWLPTYVNDIFSDKPAWPCNTLTWLAAGISIVLGGTLCDKLIQSGFSFLSARKLTQFISNVVPSCFLLLLAFSSLSFLGTVIVMIIIVSVQQLHNCGAYTYLSLINPEYAGAITGVSNGLSQIPASLAVSLTGNVLQSTGNDWSIIFLAMSGFSLLGTLIFTTIATQETAIH
ncbi:voltage-gated purine nucleotide uniporter SLC17A9-like [Oscarella lobularis]|uniref:voltage-gated purine nucleotide uniporter SLC17A9-like n=1 Tax=Oscarella lobularis TaxID=121494 RepID=UPI003313E2E6